MSTVTAIIATRAATLALPDLAARIDAAVRDAEGNARTAEKAALCAGRLLTEAKEHVAHGQWEQWLQGHCTVAPRTARAYMQLSKRQAELPSAVRHRVADLPLRDAMKAIATESKAAPQLHSTHYPKRETRDRVEKVVRQSADALRAMSRNVRMSYVKRAEVERTRTKLKAALAALDELQTDDDVVQVGVQS